MTLANWLSPPRLIAVIRLGDANLLTEAHMVAIADAGLTGIEITMTSPGATDALSRASERVGDRILVGAGTVLDARAATEAEAAGAKFLASPYLWAGLSERSVPVVPGVLTPREIAEARSAGFGSVKLFPARVGARYLSDLRVVFPEIEFLPSGGVSLENLGGWRRSGASGAFLGRALLGEDDELRQPTELKRLGRELVSAWA